MKPTFSIPSFDPSTVTAQVHAGFFDGIADAVADAVDAANPSTSGPDVSSLVTGLFTPVGVTAAERETPAYSYILRNLKEKPIKNSTALYYMSQADLDRLTADMAYLWIRQSNEHSGGGITAAQVIEQVKYFFIAFLAAGTDPASIADFKTLPTFPWKRRLPWTYTPFWIWLTNTGSKWSEAQWKMVRDAALNGGSTIGSFTNYDDDDYLWAKASPVDAPVIEGLTITKPSVFTRLSIPWHLVPWEQIDWSDPWLLYATSPAALIWLMRNHRPRFPNTTLSQMPGQSTGFPTMPTSSSPTSSPTSGFPTLPIPTGGSGQPTGSPLPTGFPPLTTGPTGGGTIPWFPLPTPTGNPTGEPTGSGPGPGDSSSDPDPTGSNPDPVAACAAQGLLYNPLTNSCEKPGPVTGGDGNGPTGNTLQPNFTNCAGALKLFDPRTGQCVDVPDDQASQDIIQSCAAQGYFYNPATNQCVLANGTPAGLQPSGGNGSGTDGEKKEESNTLGWVLGIGLAGAAAAGGWWWWKNRTPETPSSGE